MGVPSVTEASTMRTKVALEQFITTIAGCYKLENSEVDVVVPHDVQLVMQVNASIPRFYVDVM